MRNYQAEAGLTLSQTDHLVGSLHSATQLTARIAVFQLDVLTKAPILHGLHPGGDLKTLGLPH